jgi:glycosyltransferase involved in cell wall biosynthesis
LKKKCILFLNRGAVLYGAETRMLDILRNLDRNEFQALVMLPKPGHLSEVLQQIGIEVIFLNFDLGKRPAITEIYKLNRDMARVIRQYKVDILHFNMHFGISHLWPTMIWMCGRSVVHLRSHFWIYPFERFLIYRCAKIICVSDYVKNTFLQIRRSDVLTFINRDKLQTIYDGIDVESFRPMPGQGMLRQQLNIEPGQKIVAVIGALHPVKGQDLVVEAAPLIIKNHPGTRIIFIGGAYLSSELSVKYEQALKDRIRALNIEAHVLFLGPRRDIPQIMNEIDILLQPSQREALGTSMVEAMACAKPVIGTSIDGIPEVIGADEGGLLMDPRSPEQLAELVNLLLGNPELAVEKGKQGRRRVENRFNVRKTINDIQAIYRNLCKE